MMGGCTGSCWIIFGEMFPIGEEINCCFWQHETFSTKFFVRNSPVLSSAWPFNTDTVLEKKYLKGCCLPTLFFTRRYRYTHKNREQRFKASLRLVKAMCALLVYLWLITCLVNWRGSLLSLKYEHTKTDFVQAGQKYLGKTEKIR